jgi:hypothetical protein
MKNGAEVDSIGNTVRTKAKFKKGKSKSHTGGSKNKVNSTANPSLVKSIRSIRLKDNSLV